MSPARRYCSVSDSLITKPKPRYAYLTFLVDGSDYWKGALALHKSLQLVGSRYPLVVAVTKEVPAKLRTLLASQGCLIREIEVRTEQMHSQGCSLEGVAAQKVLLLRRCCLEGQHCIVQIVVVWLNCNSNQVQQCARNVFVAALREL